jgi:hypothetical protein
MQNDDTKQERTDSGSGTPRVMPPAPYDLDTLPRETVALGPVRLVGNDMRAYTVVTSKVAGRAFGWCHMMLRRARLFGLHGDHYEAQVDLYNRNGDIIGEVPVTEKAFKYLLRVLKCRWENREDCTAA